jgi:hypothetical protein
MCACVRTWVFLDGFCNSMFVSELNSITCIWKMCVHFQFLVILICHNISS